VYGTRGKVIFNEVIRINLLRFLISASLVLLLLAVSGCTSTTGPSASHQQSAVNSTLLEKVEVVHFHGNQQCVSCIAVGDLAEKTVNASFRDDLASGRLVFAHVNYELPENAALKEKYGPTGSSLWIGVYDANGFHKEEDTRVWSLINNKDAYSAYLSGVITKRLNGDLS
jgi:hypothetical protein